MFYRGRRGVSSSILPVATHSTQPTYTLFRVPEGGMVEMGCQDEMVEMESQEGKERGGTLVYRDHLACRDHVVCKDHLVCKVMYWTGLYTHPYLHLSF